MNAETKLPVHSACSLRVGSIIKLAGNELTITKITPQGEWITLGFNRCWWDPSRESWRWSYGCYFGFCFEVIQL